VIEEKDKERFDLILAKFRKGIAHRRAEGATEERIKNILAASVRMAVQQVDDPSFALGSARSSPKLRRSRRLLQTTRPAGPCNNAHLEPPRGARVPGSAVADVRAFGLL
jgi:hypothetical protein